MSACVLLRFFTMTPNYLGVVHAPGSSQSAGVHPTPHQRTARNAVAGLTPRTLPNQGSGGIRGPTRLLRPLRYGSGHPDTPPATVPYPGPKDPNPPQS
jgi:hypothetical protein